MNPEIKQIYEDMAPVELMGALQETEAEICAIHGQKAELHRQESIYQEHRLAILQLMGVKVASQTS